MRNRPSFRLLCWGLAVGLAVLASSTARAGSTLTVSSGYDLFQTVSSGTFFPFPSPIGNQNLQGVPLGSYDFGGAFGTKNVGTADTIIKRNSDVTVAALGGSATTSLAIAALQLESTNAIDNNGDHVFVTLNPNATQPTDSTMTITFNTNNGGTFTSFLDMAVSFWVGPDLAHKTLLDSTTLTLNNTGASWVHSPPPPGAQMVNGINYRLDGTDTDQDFWPGASFKEVHPGGGQHQVDPAMTPEPSTWIMYLAAGLMIPAYARWHRRRAGSR